MAITLLPMRQVWSKLLFMTVVCHSEPEIMEDGRIRLREQWQWTSGDKMKGNPWLRKYK